MAMEHNFTVITKSALTFVFSVLFYYFQNKMQILKMIFINKGCGNDFYSKHFWIFWTQNLHGTCHSCNLELRILDKNTNNSEI